MEIHGKPAVDDSKRAVNVDSYVYLIAEASQRLVNRVVDDFIYEVMQPGRACRADVHRRSLRTASSPENLDFVGAVLGDIIGVPRGRCSRARDLRSGVVPERLLGFGFLGRTVGMLHP